MNFPISILSVDEFAHLRCRKCMQVFCCEICRDKHERTVHDIYPNCHICIFGVTSVKLLSMYPSHLRDHMRLHLPAECKLCNLRFDYVEEILMHVNCDSESSSNNPPRVLDYDSPNFDALIIGNFQNVGLTSTPTVPNEERQVVNFDENTPGTNNNNNQNSEAEETDNGKKQKKRVTFLETPDSMKENIEPKSESSEEIDTSDSSYYSDVYEMKKEIEEHKYNLRMAETPVLDFNDPTNESDSTTDSSEDDQSPFKTCKDNEAIEPSPEQNEALDLSTSNSESDFQTPNNKVAAPSAEVLKEIKNLEIEVWESAVASTDKESEPKIEVTAEVQNYAETPINPLAFRKVNPAMNLIKKAMPTSTPNQDKVPNFDELQCISRISMNSSNKKDEKVNNAANKDLSDELKEATKEPEKEAPLDLSNPEDKNGKENNKAPVDLFNSENKNGEEDNEEPLDLSNPDNKNDEDENEVPLDLSISNNASNKPPTIWGKFNKFIKTVIKGESPKKKNKSFKRSISHTSDSTSNEPTSKRFKSQEIKCRKPVRELPPLPWDRELSVDRANKKMLVDKATQTDE